MSCDTRRQFSIYIIMFFSSGCTKTVSSRLYCFSYNFLHFIDLILRSFFVVYAPFTHYIGSNSAMRNLSANINSKRFFLKCIKIFGETFPLPVYPFMQCGAWNIFNTLHQTYKPISLIRFTRRKTNTTVPHYNSSYTVISRRS